jgi:uncharacterized protein YqeY
MNKYERIKSDMNESLKNGNKARRAVLADIVAAIDKASIAGKVRVEITDALVNEVLTKYKKTVQEMIDTCPDIEKYAERKAGYIADMAVVNEYAPQLITDEMEITALINTILAENGLIGTEQPKGVIMKTVMPVLKVSNCDMRVAQGILNRILK